MNEKRIGFVGLGRMGANMARCLRGKGYEVSSVFDSREEVKDAVAKELGAIAAGSPSEVTGNADVILTVVTDDAAMESIFFGPENLLRECGGKTFINCATISPETHEKIAEAAIREGAFCLEACMASSIPQALNGELFLIIAGQSEVFAEEKELLNALGKSVYYVGETGKGAQVKALVNMVMNCNTAALAEGLGLADALGLDLQMVCEIFSGTGANSRVLETDAADMIDRDHDCFFSAEHAAKDSAIALKMGEKCGIPLPLAAATLSQYEKMKELGLGGLDKSGVAELTFKNRRKKE